MHVEAFATTGSEFLAYIWSSLQVLKLLNLLHRGAWPGLIRGGGALVAIRLEYW